MTTLRALASRLLQSHKASVLLATDVGSNNGDDLACDNDEVVGDNRYMSLYVHQSEYYTHPYIHL